MLSQEQLAAIRQRNTRTAVPSAIVGLLFDHIDALTAENARLTTARDDARRWAVRLEQLLAAQASEQRADRAEQMAVRLAEALRPILPCLIDLGHVNEEKGVCDCCNERSIMMRGSSDWILKGQVRQLAAALSEYDARHAAGEDPRP